MWLTFVFFKPLKIDWPKDNYVGDEIFPLQGGELEEGDYCGNYTCAEQEDWTCLCDVALTETMGFTDNPTDEESIRSTLKIGAFPPSFVGGYDAGTDILNGQVKVYHKTDASGYSTESIFRLIDETDEFYDFGDNYKQSTDPKVGYVYLKNLVSEIRIGDPNNDYYTQPGKKPLITRNPVLFHDLADPEVRDSHYEIDAVIHHLTSHQNAPPFISLQLIQHFGVSNPSPGTLSNPGL